jgi:DNA-binding SARP family transcriptional activator
LELRLIGPLAVLRRGRAQPLPPSRKTRALLAYLAISGKPARRESLCDLLWDVPDDPRGALRWSLSKLRPIVDDGDTARLRGDREWVELDLPDEAVDWRRLRAAVRRGVAHVATEALERAAGNGALLEGLDLPRCDRFQAWCVAQREDVRQWRAAVLAELKRAGGQWSPSQLHAWARANGGSEPTYAALDFYVRRGRVAYSPNLWVAL